MDWSHFFVSQAVFVFNITLILVGYCIGKLLCYNTFTVYVVKIDAAVIYSYF